MFKRLRKNNKGISLIELVIAISIFAIIMVIVMDSFLNVIRISRESADQQNTQDHARFLYEMMLKEIKMATINDNTCSFAPNVLYETSDFDINNPNNNPSSILKFKNYKGDCVTYALVLDGAKFVLKINRGNGAVNVFPKEIQVNHLLFDVTNFKISGTARHMPPSVTIDMELQSNMWKNKPILRLQSTVTSRYIE